MPSRKQRVTDLDMTSLSKGKLVRQQLDSAEIKAERLGLFRLANLLPAAHQDRDVYAALVDFIKGANGHLYERACIELPRKTALKLAAHLIGWFLPEHYKCKRDVIHALVWEASNTEERERMPRPPEAMPNSVRETVADVLAGLINSA